MTTVADALWERIEARKAVKKLQRERPGELFPGAFGTGEMLPCGHEQQWAGATWRGCGGLEHKGRCLGCRHCGTVTAAHTRLW